MTGIFIWKNFTVNFDVFFLVTRFMNFFVNRYSLIVSRHHYIITLVSIFLYTVIWTQTKLYTHIIYPIIIMYVYSSGFSNFFFSVLFVFFLNFLIVFCCCFFFIELKFMMSWKILLKTCKNRFIITFFYINLHISMYVGFE